MSLIMVGSDGLEELLFGTNSLFNSAGPARPISTVDETVQSIAVEHQLLPDAGAKPPKTKVNFSRGTNRRPLRRRKKPALTAPRSEVFCCIHEKMEARKLLKDKKFWFASFLIAWAAALQGHMMWMQKQDSFKQKFGDLNNSDEGEK